MLSVDPYTNKVTHGNYLPPSLAAEGFDARTWAASVSEVVGGKVQLYFFVDMSFLLIPVVFHRPEESRIPPKELEQISQRSLTV